MFNLIPQYFIAAVEKIIPAEYLVKNYLSSLSYGCICLKSSGSELVYGDPSHEKKVTLVIKDPAFYTKVIIHQDIGLGEAFIDNLFECDDLVQLFEILIYNMRLNVVPTISSNLSILTTTAGAVMSKIWTNTVEASRANVKHHYDLGNEFYFNFLDRTTLGYTCGLYEKEDDTCTQAQLNKYRLIISKLRLKPTDTVLELGCGWGYFMFEAAEKIGCKCVGYNLSTEQCAYIREEVKKRNLHDRVRVVEADYRDSEVKETIKFDKIVSIGMMEHVGHYNLGTVFELADKMLKPNGIFLTHHITTLDQRYETYRKDKDFIKKYIFPGCCIPSPTAILNAATASSRFTCQHMENFGHNYATTLIDWKKIFTRNLDNIKKISDQFDDKFIRMWYFYLDYCIAGFDCNQLGLYHYVWKRPTLDSPYENGRLDKYYTTSI